MNKNNIMNSNEIRNDATGKFVGDINKNKISSYWLTGQMNDHNQSGGKNKQKQKWKTLVHNGVLFPPEYKKHNIPVLYKGDEVTLDILPEEYATLYAKYIES